MPSLSYFGVLLAIGTLLAGPLAAQDPAYVRHVLVRGSGPAIEVEIQTSGTAAPDTQAITGPDRIVVDFPGALPAADLHALKVNRGPLKGIRSGLFFNNPPITRIVLDLLEPQSYQISENGNSVIVKLGPAAPATNVAAVPAPAVARVGGAAVLPALKVVRMPVARAAQVADTPVRGAVTEAVAGPPEPPKPVVNVTFENGLLRIRAERATLAQVLFEVQRQTQAEIAIPAGAEQEQVAVDLGPAPARDVLASLLNGSSYNFIFVGNEQGNSLEKVILTRREPSF